MHEGTLVAVLAMYSETRNPYSEDHRRLAELLAPTLAASIVGVRTGIVDSPATVRHAPSDLRLLKGGRAAAR